jgi:CheY-like chemotaxis protein
MAKCILVVEDDDSIREIVKEILVGEGYKVHTAKNGQEALDLVNTIADPCLVLLDLMMPVMNGWQFLMQRKKIDRIARLPVVVVSAVAEEAKDSGATQVMRKPPDIDTLLNLVSKYCECESSIQKAS